MTKRSVFSKRFTNLSELKYEILSWTKNLSAQKAHADNKTDDDIAKKKKNNDYLVDMTV